MADLKAGLSTGRAGQENQVVMAVDSRSKADAGPYMTHPYHADCIDKVAATEYPDRSAFVAAQLEFDA